MQESRTKYRSTIEIYYQPEMAILEEISYSKSPSKPALFTEALQKKNKENPFCKELIVKSEWKPIEHQDLLLAHSERYAERVRQGETSGFGGNSPHIHRAVYHSSLYTIGSLYHSILAALDEPDILRIAPVSGFHHASPDCGSGFCTFSGQAIASLKVFHERGARGAYIDLDAHFGNSLWDTDDFNSDLLEAAPKDGRIDLCNFVRSGKSVNLEAYADSLSTLRQVMLEKKIDYIVFCHGADSLEGDPLGGQLTRDEWLYSARVFGELMNALPRPVPIIYTLFGGYATPYDHVIDAHCEGVQELCSSLF